MKTSLKRFYGAATVADGEGGHALRLDGKPSHTPGGHALTVPTAPLAEAIAGEWNAQGDVIRFDTMPMTRLAMTAIDLGETDAGKWREILRSYLNSDLLCYRAETPAALIERQCSAWDPLLEWASRSHGISLATGAGIAAIEQPEAAIAAGERLFGEPSSFTLLAMKEAAEISGSAVIALALAKDAFAPETLFAASRVDEAFQGERWGRDADAAAREARLRRDFMDIATFVALLRS